jgi:YfiH family protein
VSEGIYTGLNCGFGSADNPGHVAENRKRVATAMGGKDRVLTVHQIHSAECMTVHEPWARGDEPKLDALVTDRPGIILGILTADCGPVLLHGLKHDGSPVIGAAHAGWGGALNGVLENTLQAMTRLGARPVTIRAALGPCIGPRSYEVSDGFEAPFIKHDDRAVKFFREGSRPGYRLFNLPAYIKFRLDEAGVHEVSVLANDTCAEEQDFFSYRRSRLRGEPDYGRQISTIMIR